MNYRMLCSLTALLVTVTPVTGYLPDHIPSKSRSAFHHHQQQYQTHHQTHHHQLAAAKYGPESRSSPSNNNDEDIEFQRAELLQARMKEQFREFLDTATATDDPNHMPQILARNVDVILSLHGYDGAEILNEFIEKSAPEDLERKMEIVEMIVSFTEDFVDQAGEMDGQNKKLLGKIVKTMTNKDETTRDREDMLDEIINEEKPNFTPGFFRHLDGECERIANAPKMTPESARLLEIIRIIQARILEELGKDLGEGAVVLGQLMGYDNKDEMIGVLDAGLTVRGMDFATELKELTEEALAGFQQVRGEIEPELVDRVKAVDNRLQAYMDKQTSFQ